MKKLQSSLLDRRYGGLAETLEKDMAKHKNFSRGFKSCCFEDDKKDKFFLMCKFYPNKKEYVVQQIYENKTKKIFSSSSGREAEEFATNFIRDITKDENTKKRLS